MWNFVRGLLADLAVRARAVALWFAGRSHSPSPEETERTAHAEQWQPMRQDAAGLEHPAQRTETIFDPDGHVAPSTSPVASNRDLSASASPQDCALAETNADPPCSTESLTSEENLPKHEAPNPTQLERSDSTGAEPNPVLPSPVLLPRNALIQTTEGERTSQRIELPAEIVEPPPLELAAPGTVDAAPKPQNAEALVQPVEAGASGTSALLLSVPHDIDSAAPIVAESFLETTVALGAIGAPDELNARRPASVPMADVTTAPVAAISGSGMSKTLRLVNPLYAEQPDETVTNGSRDTSRRPTAEGIPKTPSGNRERPRPPRPPPESYEQPFVASGLLALPEEYTLWNRAIVRHCLLADAPEGEESYLTITPGVLAGAWSEAAGGTLAPDEAEERFVDAVSVMYRTRVLPHAAGLQLLRRCGGDDLPECAAFLALAVLAAYRMHTDEDMAGSAYYKRLDELLNCGLSGWLPRGFDPDEFEGLWLFLRGWLGREHGRRLAMPGSNVGVRRYVALPLTHVPLRKVDIEKLPAFFADTGYEAGGRVPLDRLDSDISRWMRGRTIFTSAGTAALVDERRSAVLAQIAHELDCWDGSYADAQERRTAPIELFLDWVRRRPELFYLPRRPATFPDIFNDGLHVLEAGQEGWYEPLPLLAEDGADLRSGFSWEAKSQELRVVLRRAGTSAIAMTPSEFAGPISHKGLLLGAVGAVLCLDGLVEQARQYLEGVTGQRSVAVQLPNLPAGWSLFTGIKPVQRRPPPGGLEALEVLSDVEIIPRGGLRLGRRWAWLAGAPPTLLVAGFDPTQPIRIDGELVRVDDGGVLIDHGWLARPGVHVVEVGRLRRRVEIVEPDLVAADLLGGALLDDRRGGSVGLPRGSWTVVGPRPGDAVWTAGGRWGEGVLVTCAFDPVWAVAAGPGPGAIVLSLSEDLPAPDRLPRTSTAHSLQRMRSWADAIYCASIRRPRIAAAFSGAVGADVRALWGVYADRAREIKRRLRAAHR